jgi:ABC-type arginine transport system permease subunit
MASGIHRFRPISPRSPMLIKHRLSHLTKGMIFPLNHTILTSHIGKRKLMFETQITTKGFKMRVFKFTAIVATNSLNSISISLILQPQD